MTYSNLCTLALFMKDTENVKNYFKTEVESNSVFPRSYHISEGLWFIATQNIIEFTVVFPLKQKETLTVNSPLDIIKLNMSCISTSIYLTLLPYYHNESKLNTQDQFLDNLKSYNGSNLQIWKSFISPMLNFTKTDIPAVLKDTKDIPTRHFILTAYKSRTSGQISMARWIYLATTIPTLTILGMGIIAVYYKCKKRSVKIYRLARKRGYTMEIPGYNAVPAYTGDRDDIYMEEDNSTHYKEDSVVLTVVMQKQDHEVEAKSAFPVLRLAPPVTTQV